MNHTTIEWTDRTWNPVTGCTKVSQGCKNCYAERFFERFNGKGTFNLVHLHPERLDAPNSWKKPSMIFVNSMSDLFHEAVPFVFIQRVYLKMFYIPRHTYQILTKRPDRALLFFEWLKGADSVMYERLTVSKNIWHGVSVENQTTADQRIPLLLQFPVPVRFLSCEPLLGPVNINTYYSILHPSPLITAQHVTAVTHGPSCETSVQWVIVGGESGPNARPMHPDWARSIRNVCKDYAIPFFFKQWGQWLPFEPTAQMPWYRRCSDGVEFDAHEMNFMDDNHDPGRWMGGRWMDGFDAMHYCFDTENEQCMFLSFGKKKAGYLLDGRTHQEFPNLNK